MTKRVLVGFSGGVDSAVTAELLRRDGYEVVAATMKVAGPDGRGCGNAGDHLAAERLAEEMGIPFHLLDCSAEWSGLVLENFRREYRAGRTPNPCVQCNPTVKFSALPEKARRAGIDFDLFATGHYARIDPAGPTLLRGVDATKDQSYFLYRLSRGQLASTLFPLGVFLKKDVRELARSWRLPVHDKPDSQDFFAGDYVSLLDFPDRPGDIVDREGKVLGGHNGYWHFTIGQRKGLRVAFTEALYVIGLDAENNRVIVGTQEEQMSSGCSANAIVFAGSPPAAGMRCQGRVRSAQPLRAMTVTAITDHTVTVAFAEPIQGVAPGQSLVLYDGDRVLGGGIILSRTE